ncbi:MAG: hypothetical protein D4R43_01510, partial [Sphingobacteriales bacterium]
MKNSNSFKLIISIFLALFPLITMAQVQGEKPVFPLMESFVFVVVVGSFFVIALIIYVFAKNMMSLFRTILNKSALNKTKAMLVIAGTMLPMISSAQDSNQTSTSFLTNWYTTPNLMFLLLLVVFLTLFAIVGWISFY